MKVQMTKQMSGTRDGADWPAPGETLEVSDDEGRQLVRSGMAEVPGDVKDGPETADAPPKPRARRKT